MDRPAEPLKMYGSPADLPTLDWSWVEETLRGAGSYWVTPLSGSGPPVTRPVWGVWRDGRLELSIGSPHLRSLIAPAAPVTVNLGSDTDVVIVEGVVGDTIDDATAIAGYDAKYDWSYSVDEYGPLTIVEPTKIMAWRSAGWAGRDGFQEAGRWRFESTREYAPAHRVHALGGVFFRSPDPEATRAWYAEHLGLGVDPYGSTFTWRRDHEPGHRGHTQWSPFGDDTDYFGDHDQQFMVNYRVDDLDGLLDRLRAAGVEIVDEMQVEPFGRFQHIVDGDGRRVELWEPNDEIYETEVDGITPS